MLTNTHFNTSNVITGQSRSITWSDVIEPRVPNAKTASPLPLDSPVISEDAAVRARAEQLEHQFAKTTSKKMSTTSKPAQKSKKRKRGRPKKNSIQNNKSKTVIC